MTALHHDYETKSEIDLKKSGLDVYSSHPSTKVIMCSYAFDDGPVKLWTVEDGPFPRELAEAIEDPHVERWAFNAAFERIIGKRVLGLKTGYTNWRCAQVLAYMQGFVGGLEQVGRQIGLPEDKQKIADGKRLMRLFSMPQKITKKNLVRWRDAWTDPEEWEQYGFYCIGDTGSERAIKQRLIKYPIPALEWRLYEIDQKVNDRGIPVDPQFIENARLMSARRKAELTSELTELTGLANPNSPAQLTAWLRDRGYPFSDLRKDTVKKVLAENAEAAKATVTMIDEDTVEAEVSDDGFISAEAWKALLLRQQVARTSVRKYDAIQRLMGHGDRLRYGFQFHGASRTGRDAGRGLNPQNLTRTPDMLEVSKDAIAAGVPADFLLSTVTDLIRAGDYDGLALTVPEPLNALAGTVRSAVRAPEGYDLIAADLSSIETCVIAWVSGCERLLGVIAKGMDPYKDFGTELYSKAYEDISKIERTNSKPAVLGAGFRLGGGELREGKRTGLWGYAESMGINLTREESHRAVRLFRETYNEIPQLWYALEDACKKALRTGSRVRPIIKIGTRRIVVPVTFEKKKPYLTVELPSGRRLFYYKPRLETVVMTGANGDTWEKENLSYMGKQQNGNAWVRVLSHGGKLTENIVQAIARDILFVGLLRAEEEGFKIILRVHDELVAMIRKGENRLTHDFLAEVMTRPIDWAAGMPLGAAGWRASFYRKD